MKCDICGGDKRVVGYCGLVYNPKGIPPLIHYVCLNCTIGVKPVEKKKWMCPECGSTRLLDPVADVVDIITDLGFRLDRAEETIKELMKDLEDRRRYRD